MEAYDKLKKFNFTKFIKKDFTKPKLKCLIFGNFGACNSGDEAILKGEIDLLRSENINDITVVCRFPDLYHKTKLKTLSLFQIIKIISTILTSDFIIIGGGGLFAKSEKYIHGFIFQLYLLLIFILFPKILGKKVYILGLGIYDNGYSFILKLSFLIFKLADLITTRDFHSYNYLHDNGVSSLIYKDLSYFMKLVSKSAVMKQSPFNKSFSKKKYNIGLSLVGNNFSFNEKRIISNIKREVPVGIKTCLWLYCLDTHPRYKNDLNFARIIIKKMQSDTYMQKLKLEYIIVPNNLPPEILFSSFKLMNFFLGMRLHSLIFCNRLNIPFVGLPYDKKCVSFLESIGMWVTNDKNKKLIGLRSKGVSYGY